ncbi:MAG: ABC transporter ATP-binding protein [Ectothiorhodospiraceae bacterium]|nr:ABC transporter ATP-binding protein [Chromatiales bacterium]MCP5154830.1 ABC transporter ATP-binding protein [Ectothiorhodospiraceae bacterium]
MTAPALIEVRDLSIGFTGRAGETLPVLRNVDLVVGAGETVGLVGESGSGKSTLALAMMGYLKGGLRVLGGGTRFRDRETFRLTARALQTMRGGDLALIPQNAGQALTPTLRVSALIAEALRLHSRVPAAAHHARAIELLAQVRLPDPEALLRRYPHELSGGQQQRVAIAMALAGEPNALLLDEPTTGLDVTTQAHVLELLRDLAARTGTAMVYVSHDLGAIARVCDRVVVMYAGELVLDGSARSVLRAPAHPYAHGLVASIPRLGGSGLPRAMEGRPPPPGGAGVGCAFVDRCALAVERCRAARPALDLVLDGTRSRCHRAVDAAARSARGEPASPRARASADPSTPALRVRDLCISYARPRVLDQLLGREPDAVPTVDGITLDVARGETLALVGESGSGKSSILKALAGLVTPRGGAVALADGEALAPSVELRTPAVRREIQLVFQNPDESLNPRHTVAEILAQPLRLYFDLDAEALRERSAELLERVRLGPHYLERLPAQLSGGEKQRVAIARAFAARPSVVLCDEVTSALDVSVQAAVLDLLDQLRAEARVTYVFVSHDLAVVRALADRVVVLYQGRVCELGPVGAVYDLPAHPYTEMLLRAVLEPDPDVAPSLLGEDVVERAPPARGCPFQRRCHRRVGEICASESPPVQLGGDGHQIRCHRPLAELARLQALEAPAASAPPESAGNRGDGR